MAKPTLKTLKRLIGDYVLVEFVDHDIGSDSDDPPTEISALGKLVRVERQWIVLCHWEVEDDESTWNENNEVARIFRPAINSVRRLSH